MDATNKPKNTQKPSKPDLIQENIDYHFKNTKNQADLKDYQIQKEKGKDIIHVPLFYSIMVKKIQWNEVNKSAKIMLTLICRNSNLGFENIFHGPKEELDDLKFDIDEVNFRVNDEMMDDLISRDVHQDLCIVYSNKKEKEVIGKVQTLRLTLESVLLDMDAPEESSMNQSLFPIDEATLTLNFDFYPIKIDVQVDESDNKIYTNKEYDNITDSTRVKKSQEVRQHLQEAKCVNDMISIKKSSIDYLETHNFQNNQEGQNQFITGKNKISQQIKVLRDPQDTIKTAITPLMVLMLISIATTSFGPADSQLANLLAIYLAYGQFIMIFNEKTLDSKIYSIADYLNLLGIIINLIQFFTIVRLAWFGMINNNGEPCSLRFSNQEGPNCMFLQFTTSVSIGLQIGTLSYFLSWFCIQKQIKIPISELYDQRLDNKTNRDPNERSDKPTEITFNKWTKWNQLWKFDAEMTDTLKKHTIVVLDNQRRKLNREYISSVVQDEELLEIEESIKSGVQLIKAGQTFIWTSLIDEEIKIYTKNTFIDKYLQDIFKFEFLTFQNQDLGIVSYYPRIISFVLALISFLIVQFVFTPTA